MIWDDVEIGNYFKRTYTDNRFIIGKVTDMNDYKLTVDILYNQGVGCEVGSKYTVVRNKNDTLGVPVIEMKKITENEAVAWCI